MFTTLQHCGLTNVVAVVSRYFGGIKLGAGGLVRAYSEATQQAIDAAGTREVRLMKLIRVDVDYADAGHYENQLRGLSLPSGLRVAVVGVEWAARAEITVGVDAAAVAEFASVLQSLSAGTLAGTPVGERWVG